MARVEDKRDKICLNLFWMYGTGMITKEFFIESIDKIKYDITEEKVSQVAGNSIIHLETTDGHYLCNQSTNTFESKKTKEIKDVTCKNCLSMYSKKQGESIDKKDVVKKKMIQSKKSKLPFDGDMVRRAIADIKDEDLYDIK